MGVSGSFEVSKNMETQEFCDKSRRVYLSRWVIRLADFRLFVNAYGLLDGAVSIALKRRDILRLNRSHEAEFIHTKRYRAKLFSKPYL